MFREVRVFKTKWDRRYIRWPVFDHIPIAVISAVLHAQGFKDSLMEILLKGLAGNLFNDSS